jgi:hypothetical protein
MKIRFVRAMVGAIAALLSRGVYAADTEVGPRVALDFYHLMPGREERLDFMIAGVHATLLRGIWRDRMDFGGIGVGFGFSREFKPLTPAAERILDLSSSARVLHFLSRYRMGEWEWNPSLFIYTPATIRITEDERPLFLTVAYLRNVTHRYSTVSGGMTFDLVKLVRGEY